MLKQSSPHSPLLLQQQQQQQLRRMADSSSSNAASTQYWCYHCRKWVSVSIQPNLPDVICLDCNHGFVESISSSPPPPLLDDHSLLGHQFLNILSLISQAARESDAPSPSSFDNARVAREVHAPPPLARVGGGDDLNPHLETTHVARVVDAPTLALLDPVDGEGEDEDHAPAPLDLERVAGEDDVPPHWDVGETDDGDGEFLGFELQAWGNDEEYDDDDDEEEEDEEDNEDYIYNNEDVDGDNQGNEDRELDDDEDDGDIEGVENNSLEEDGRSRRVVEALRRTLIGDRSGGRLHEALRRNRILDWAEILMGLEDHSIELRLQMPQTGYIGNPGDYVDAAGYEALLQNLAESDNGGRRGAPPASKVAVEELEIRVIGSENEVVSCSVCKDLLDVGEKAKRLPCGHLYHGDCIVHWLGVRNSCPICRYELPTDNPEYEEERRKKVNHGKSSSSSGVRAEVGVDGGDDDVHPPTE